MHYELQDSAEYYRREFLVDFVLKCVCVRVLFVGNSFTFSSCNLVIDAIYIKILNKLHNIRKIHRQSHSLSLSQAHSQCLFVCLPLF